MGNLQVCHHGHVLVLVCSPSGFGGWTLEELCDYGNMFYKVPTLPPNSGQIISPSLSGSRRKAGKTQTNVSSLCVLSAKQTISQLSLEEIFVIFNVFILRLTC